MKSIVRCMVLVLAFVVSAVVAQAESPADITFSTQVVDLGTLSQSDDKQVVAVEYTNTGDKPLVVLEVRTTCSCTTIKHDRKKLMPGDKASITITMDPSKAPKGNFYRVLQVISTARNKINNITLKAEIK